MKNINARTALISLVLGLALTTQAQAEDYYFYEGRKGELVITNREPPPGSKIIKRVPGTALGSEVPKAQAPGKPQTKLQPEASKSK